MRKRKILKGVGYAAFTMLALLVSFYLTFPAEAVGQRLTHEVSQRTGGKLNVSFDDVALYRLSGIEASGVKVRFNKPGQQPLDFKVDGVRARLRLLPLLWLSTSFEAALELGEGTLEARVTPGSKGEISAAITAEKLNLASPALLSSLAGMPIRGVVNGTLSADLRSDTKLSSGDGKVTLGGVTVGPGSVQGLTIPSIDLGKLELELAIEGGRLKISSFKQQGGQVQVRLSGSSTLRPQFETSTLDGCVEVKADPTFLEKNPNMKIVAQLAETKYRKNAQGYMNIPLGGTLGKPVPRTGLCRTQPAAPSPSAAAASPGE